MAGDLEDLKKQIASLQQDITLVRLDVRKIRKRLALNSVYGFLKLLIILLPLVVGYFYFQPQLQSLYESWEYMSTQLNVMRGQDPPSQGMQAADINQLLNQYPEIVEQLRK
jgi:hypothetical protein